MAILNIVLLLQDHYPSILASLLVTYIIYLRFQKGLNKVPGPLLNSITPLPRIWSVWLGHSHDDDLKLHQKYGNIVRLSPTTISLSDPKEIEKLYGVSTKFYKSEFYKPIIFYDEEGIIPDPFVLTDKKLHTRMKRNAGNAYSLNALIKLEPLVDAVVERLVSKLDTEYADSGKVCDIGNMMHCFAMDTIFMVTFGKDLKFVENGDSKKMLQGLDEGQAYMAVVGQVPWTHAFFNSKIVTTLFPGNTHHFFEELMHISIDETKAALDKVDEESNGPLTFLQLLLINQKKNPSLLTDREISTHTFGNILAGSDTTSIALRSIVLQLLKHPSAYARLVSEIRETAKLTFPVSFADANRLPYLGAVIKEGMRLHPSVGMILARTVPLGGAVLGGINIQAGVEVGVNPYIAHRDPVTFPDPEAFLPERWLTKDAEQQSLMSRAFIVFGAGAHTCSGKHISIMEITKLVPSLLVKYDFALEDGFSDVRIKNHFFMGMYGLKVTVKSTR